MASDGKSCQHKRVKFARVQEDIPVQEVSGYANIVLHYLSKLKNLFHQATPSTTSSESTQYLQEVDTESGDLERQSQAYAIVDAALQYGFANNVIEQVGDYFLVKKRSSTSNRIQSRRPTPGPDFVRCSNCKNLATTKRRDKYCNGDYRGIPSTKRRRNSSYNNYCTKCYGQLKRNKNTM